jgi:CheY-like chemotaxis protein
VLIVDDEPVNASVLAEALSFHGLPADRVHSGQEALARLNTQDFDVVLMDMHMPGQSGVEVLQELRSFGARNLATPVVVVTADTVSRTRDEYLALGFFELLTKPVAVPGLIGVVLRAARSRSFAGRA